MKVALVDAADYVINLATHDAFDDVTVAGRVALSAALGTKTNTDGVLDAADVTLTAVAGDPSELIILYKDSGVEATSFLLAAWDTATGLPVTPNGGDITITWDNGANKILKL